MHCKQNYTFAVSICVKMAAQNDVFELIINGSQYNSWDTEFKILQQVWTHSLYYTVGDTFLSNKYQNKVLANVKIDYAIIVELWLSNAA
jgi:hypothetical protein